MADRQAQPRRKSHAPIPKGRGYRHKMVYMLFTTCLVSYCLRFNLSMAMLGMVSHSVGGGGANSTCPNLMPSDSSKADEGEREFDWSPHTQAMISGAFFLGYFLASVPGGVAAQRYGGKWVVEGGLLATSALALVIPLAARAHEWALIGVRLLQGVTEGVLAPAMHVILAQWCPPLERSAMAATTFAGNPAGALLAMLLSGLMIYSRNMDAWPEIFYVSGSLGVVWCVVWALFANEHPWDNPDMSTAEKEYIRATIGDQVRREYRSVPWGRILGSKAAWAVMIAQSGNGIGNFTVMSALPTYLSKVLHYDIKLNSWLSGLPYVGMLLVMIINGEIATWLVSSGATTTLRVRQVSNSIGHWLPAVAFLALVFVECNRELAVTLIFVALSLGGSAPIGFFVSSLDIAPQHAGVLLGLGNVLPSIVLVVSPQLIRLIGHDPYYWHLLFGVVAAVLFIDNALYVAFVSDKEQDFNRE